MTKKCSQCKEVKPLSGFYKNSASKDGHRADCIVCHGTNHLTYRMANQAKNQQRLREYGVTHASELKNAYLVRHYNMTLDQYLVIFEAQGGVCKICRQSSTRALAVDHDHACCPGAGVSCGKCIRGLLCFNCNKGLGNFQDDVALLTAAIAYLNSEPIAL